MPKILSLDSINQIDASKFVDNFQELNGKLKSGYVEIAGEKYKLSFRHDKTNIAIRAEREYTGKFSFFKNLFFSRTQSAHLLAKKIESIIRSPQFKMLYNNLKELHKVISENKNNTTVEVANYGLAPNRDVVNNANLIGKFNNHFKTQIKFNKIDDYNDAIGVNPTSLTAKEYKDTMSKISNRQLEINISPTLDNKKLIEWTNFLARPENLKKIDIPKKLYEYIHQEKCDWNTKVKTTGWKAEFSANPDKALRNFIIKNTNYNYRDTTEEELQIVQNKFKEYIEIYNIPDDNDRKQKMDDFFKLENWQTDEQKLSYKKEYDELIADGERKEDVDDYLQSTQGLDSLKSYQYFNSILSYATFRQTSKMGLSFFHEQKVPVLFQYSDYSGKSLKNTSDTVLRENFWKSGQFKKDCGGSAITHSEMRHAERMRKEFGDAFNLKLAFGGN